MFIACLVGDPKIMILPDAWELDLDFLVLICKYQIVSTLVVVRDLISSQYLIADIGDKL